MKLLPTAFLFLMILSCGNLFLQVKEIPKDRIMTDAELISMLKPVNPEIAAIKDEATRGGLNGAIEKLAEYFKEKFAERYFFNWKNFRERLLDYSEKFPSEKESRINAAEQQITTYSADTKWKLPFKNLKGQEVTSYEFQHLTRQNKAVDLAFAFFYSNEDTSYMNYFVRLAASIDKALEEKKYESTGNDIYESYRCGYRMFNWLFAHNVFLSSKKYNTRDQIILIKTFLQTGAILYKKTRKFSYGNHHTKGLSSLFQLAVMFPEVEGTDAWLKQSVELLDEHIAKEINSDGFQFERSVHYHVGDIDNYFYAYQLAKISNIPLPENFVSKLKSMFDALVKIAQPNGTLPVEQDDTDEPWSEFNSMKEVMALGFVLFRDKTFRYFSADEITADRYWLIAPEDAAVLYKEKGTKPDIGSTALNETGYYVMRNGWNKSSEYMILSNGLSKEKPDHQHGDMLGIEAYANGEEILPNYQVRYFLPDYDFFKNSWTKNAALVDSIPQGSGWKPNEGRTGFGKWLKLPKPKTILWHPDTHYVYYLGTHNGYDDLGVKYFREVYFIKSGFWIVRDNFISAGIHNYQQVWQGHYSEEAKGVHLRSSFSSGSGMDIIQLDNSPANIFYGSFQGKGNSVFQTKHDGDFNYTTLIFPFKDFGGRMDDAASDSIKVKDYLLIKNPLNKILEVNQINTDADFILLLDYQEMILLSAGKLKLGNYSLGFSNSPSFSVKLHDRVCLLTYLGYQEINLTNPIVSGIKIIRHDTSKQGVSKMILLPGDKIEIRY